MSKIIPTLIIISIFLFASLSQASRPHPHFLDNHSASSHQQEISDNQVGEVDEVERENCEDIGNEECLMRRTLVAHIDYIYTQKQKP
ncbi:hypothetical protein ACET3Z_010997 [Daucus carota]